MPMAIRSACRKRGCPGRSNGTGYCVDHAPKPYETIREKGRPSAHKRGYTGKWRKARLGFLRKHPLCASCKRGATLVDHIVPHRGDDALFWDRKNWQPLCKRCHAVKSARGE